MHRRHFLHRGSLFLLAGGATWSQSSRLLAMEADPPAIRVGLVTDVHYADIPAAGSRYYRQSLAKMEEARGKLALSKPDLFVELGDLIDAADTVEGEQQHLERINKLFSTLPGPKHYVLGNHCVYTLTKKEFLSTVAATKSYYSFEAGGFHFVILDACFRGDEIPYGRKNNQWTDSAIPAAELDWLRADLKEARHPCIVFVHQRLDETQMHSVRNRQAVRRVLEEAGNVLAVFQGHSHQNDYQQIKQIHYCTLAAMVEGMGEENNAYALLEIHKSGDLKLTGFRRQKSYAWQSSLGAAGGT